MSFNRFLCPFKLKNTVYCSPPLHIQTIHRDNIIQALILICTIQDIDYTSFITKDIDHFVVRIKMKP